MSGRITIGEIAYPADIRNVRGAITIGVSQREDADGGRPMIGIAAAMMGTSCFVRLTIEEAEMLRGALDTLTTEATARLGDSGNRDERSAIAELLTTTEDVREG